jgi:hypothetical protein
VLALDLLGPAHLAGERLAAAQFLDVGFPAHALPHPSIVVRRDYSICGSRYPATEISSWTRLAVAVLALS